MKIVFKDVEISNFLSFGREPVRVGLDSDLMTLVIGDNQDVGTRGMSANAVGKTAQMNAIIWALYGKGIDSRMKQDAFINLKNEKRCVVKLRFMVGDDEYLVIRSRKPNSLEFYKNDESYTLDSKGNTDESIRRVIGISYELFLNTYFLSPDAQSFMAMKPAEQRDFMEEVLSLDLLSERAESVKAMKKTNQQELEVENRLIEQHQASNSKVEKEIETKKQEAEGWDLKQKEAIEKAKKSVEANTFSSGFVEKLRSLIDQRDALNKTISGYQKELNACRQQYHTAQLTYTQLEKTKSQLDSIDEAIEQWDSEQKESIKSIEKELLEFDIDWIQSKKSVFEQIDSKQKEVDAMEKDMAHLDERISDKESKRSEKKEELETLLKGECPYCHQTYHDENDSHCESIREAIKSLDDEIQQLTDDFVSYENQYERITTEIASLKEQTNGYTRKDIDSLESDYSKRKTQYETEIGRVNPYRQQKDELEKQFDASRFQEAHDEMISLSETIDNLDDLLTQNQDERDDVLEKIYDYHDGPEDVTVDWIQTVQTQYDNAVEKLETLKTESNPYRDQIELLEGQLHVIDTSKKDALSKRIEHCGFLVKLLTDNKSFIRRRIVNQYVPFLTQRINEYLVQLESLHYAEIHSDLTVSIEYMSKDVSYGNLSKGERLRLDLATSLAFKDLLGMLGRKTNLMLIDEYLDSALDRSGFRSVLDLIKKYTDTIFLVSHREEIEKEVDRVLRVIKKAGFSRLEWTV